LVELSIIIVSWNTRELLFDCLQSLQNEIRGIDAQVWVIDNASTDGSPAAVREKFPEVNLLVNTENVGFSRANNQGAAQASGKTIMFLNSDTVVKSGSVLPLLRYLQANPGAGACGPLLRNPDGSLQESCYPFPSLSRELWRLLHLDALLPYGTYRMEGWDLRANREVQVIKGACLVVRRDVLERVGTFDPDYFMYTEEVDLCFRIHRAGWKLFWLPQSEIIHYGGQSTRQAAPRMFQSLYQTKILFFRKNYGQVSANLYKFILWVTSWIRIASISLVALLTSGPKKQFYQTLKQNYSDLIKVLPQS
jgi:GT2 family glycosyltransferase